MFLPDGACGWCVGCLIVCQWEWRAVRAWSATSAYLLKRTILFIWGWEKLAPEIRGAQTTSLDILHCWVQGCNENFPGRATSKPISPNLEASMFLHPVCESLGNYDAYGAQIMLSIYTSTASTCFQSVCPPTLKLWNFSTGLH